MLGGRDPSVRSIFDLDLGGFRSRPHRDRAHASTDARDSDRAADCGQRDAARDASDVDRTVLRRDFHIAGRPLHAHRGILDANLHA